MPFDVEGAKKAGYTDSEIADHLAKQSKFDIAGARKAGYSDPEIVSHLAAQAVRPVEAPNPARTKAIEEPAWWEKQVAKLPNIMSPRTESMARGFAMGMAEPSVGAAQLVANVAGQGQRINPAIAAKEAEYLAAKQGAGREGFDWMKAAGNVLSPVNLLLAARLGGPAAGAGGRAIQGGKIGAATGATQTVTDETKPYAEQKLEQIAFGTIAGVAGQQLGELASKGLAKAQQALLSRKTQNLIRDTALSAGREAGYVVPPSDVQPSMWNSMLGGISGKIKTSQKASEMNQAITNDLAKASIGIDKDMPLTEEALQGIRSNAGKAYEAIKTLPTKFRADEQFAQDIGTLGNDFSVAAREFPEIASNPAIESLQKALNKAEISPTGAMELIKKLRYDSAKNFKAFDDPAKSYLAGAQKDAANALEDLIERNLAGSGKEALLNNFRQARELIAKTYSVESAMQGGNVVAGKLASQLSRGKPLSGELRTAAEFSQAFPKATQTLKEPTGATSPLDWALAMGTGNPLLMAARPTIRNMLLSRPYQAMATTPSYEANALLRTISDPTVRQYLPGASAVIANQ